MTSHSSTDVENLRSIFVKYASVVSNGAHYMTPKDLVVRFLQLMQDVNCNDTSVNFIAGAVDTTNDGLISFEEFLAFEALLRTSDSLYSWAFEILNRNKTGSISFDNFKQIMMFSTTNRRLQFDFNCDFMNLHFGKEKLRHLTYEEFTQIIHDFNDELAVQAFKQCDKDNMGTISAMQFKELMTLLKSHLLNQFLREHLPSVAFQGEKHGRITFAYYIAFISLLSNMELVKKIYLSRTHGNSKVELTKEEMLEEVQHYTQITPMELNILFQLVSLIRQDGRLTYKELLVISPTENTMMLPQLNSKTASGTGDHSSGVHRSVLSSVFEQIYRFALGSVAGATGATAVYPIDLVKTRMQNQRVRSSIGELMYRNSWDCFRKVIQFEGFTGLYRGLVPQLVGVAPEKAIKLTVNDIVRDQFTNSDGDISIYAEILAGGCAGGSQVVFTNPLEIVKIRLQVAGEIATTKRISALSVIRDLGLFGLYKGARACFLRDIPFSAIYFTAYSNLKRYFATEEGYNSPTSLLCAATLSGAPAACLTTPADVIKTRLQVVARTGQTTYTGIFDATKKIWNEEGGRAFWKGAGARVLRSSPQFGVTLLTYELLQRFFNVDFGGRQLSGTAAVKHSGPVLSTNPDHIGGYQLATSTFCGIESKLGLCFPKYKLT